MFTTPPQAHKSVQVFGINAHKFLNEVTGFGNAHGIVYRDDLDQVYVSDGGDAAEVKIFSGQTAIWSNRNGKNGSPRSRAKPIFLSELRTSAAHRMQRF